jgi:hypothetical protein
MRGKQAREGRLKSPYRQAAKPLYGYPVVIYRSFLDGRL